MTTWPSFASKSSAPPAARPGPRAPEAAARAPETFMTSATKTFWPTAHNFAEAVQCPAICFAEPGLRAMLPAVDRLGMPLVTSGQFAYVFKLNPQAVGDSLAVRCFRGF